MRLIGVMAVWVCLLVGSSAVAEESHEPDVSETFQRTEQQTATLNAYFDDERTRGLLRVQDGDLDWTSPVYPAWKVRVADLDGDGRDEVVLGTWSTAERHDEPRPHRAVWVLGWRGDRLEELWRGSALARPMRDFSVADLDDDGHDELLSLERVDKTCMLSAYRWSGFGFGGEATTVTECDARFSKTNPACLQEDACYELDGEKLREAP